MTTSGPSSPARRRGHWPLVLASMAGLSMSAIAPSSIGLFMEPLQREFGWSRAQISVGMTIYALVAFPLSPIGGMMIDRWGSRRIAIPGTILTAVAIAGFGSASGSAVQWLALWLFYAFAALAVKPTVWSAAVTGVFTGGRGLALALTLSGNAIAQTLVPVLAQRLIDTQGWRSAYQWIGLGWGAAVLILLVPFFYGAGDRRDDASPGTRAQVRASLYGITPRQALRTPVLIRIAIATLIGTMTSAALTIHLVPILSERGIDRETAALLAALTGIMGIVGKLVTGSLYDRRDLRWLNPLSLWIALVACLILLFAPGTLALAALATAIIGYSGGALLQVCAYLTGRFCGVRYFGTIFGTMTSMIALGVGLGPFLAGLSYDLSGSYTPMLIGLLPLMAISGLLLIRLGPYPDWRQPAG